MIKTTYLKIKQADLTRQPRPADAARLTIHPLADARRCAALYKEVGKPYYWDIYRLGWNAGDWQDYLRQPDVHVSLIRDTHGVVGYLELKRHGDAVEIVNFGLRPGCIGRGLGKLALEAVIEHGFSLGAGELWLHTCNLDHPAALKNYYARGFAFVREQVDNFLPLDPSPRGAAMAA